MVVSTWRVTLPSAGLPQKSRWKVSMRKARATQRMNRAIGTTLARVTMALVIAALCTPWEDEGVHQPQHRQFAEQRRPGGSVAEEGQRAERAEALNSTTR
ncbi:Uncharacterised protein [Pseudomonas aeruginosa]|nr:Uncharacterised protein [Pseudomonas aeruginosa]